MKTWQDSRLIIFLVTVGLAVLGALAVGAVYDTLDARFAQFVASAGVILLVALLAARLTRRPARPQLRPKEVAVGHDPVREVGTVKWFNID
ncbi:MAG TPA: hypothetical protein ENO19_01045, partial [Halothiobacillaceae bacterium]|nr:hypothetical protein [Halothiobacillaceae bacterium]